MIFYKKHQLRSAYDLDHCRSILKKFEDFNVDYQKNLFNHPTQYFIRWIDRSRFWFKVMVWGSRSYNPKYVYQVEISGSEKSPIFMVQRRLGYYDGAPVVITGLIFLSSIIMSSFDSKWYPTVGLLAVVFILVAVFSLKDNFGYDFLRESINSVEMDDEAKSGGQSS